MENTLPNSVITGRSALQMALTENRDDEAALREKLRAKGINAVATENTILGDTSM